MQIFQHLPPTLVPWYLGKLKEREYDYASGPHGISHWALVARNGAHILWRCYPDASKPGNTIVNPPYCAKVFPEARLNLLVSLFALFHDSCRDNDFDDPLHGARAAMSFGWLVPGVNACLRGRHHPVLGGPLTFLEERMVSAACAYHTHESPEFEYACSRTWYGSASDIDSAHAVRSFARLCCDADRLDIYRVGFDVAPHLLFYTQSRAVNRFGANIVSEEERDSITDSFPRSIV